MIEKLMFIIRAHSGKKEYQRTQAQLWRAGWQKFEAMDQRPRVDSANMLNNLVVLQGPHVHRTGYSSQGCTND